MTHLALFCSQGSEFCVLVCGDIPIRPQNHQLLSVALHQSGDHIENNHVWYTS